MRDATEVASEANLIGAVDGDYALLAGPSPYLDHHRVPVRDPNRRLRRLQDLLSSDPVPGLKTPAPPPYSTWRPGSRENRIPGEWSGVLEAGVSWREFNRNWPFLVGFFVTGVLVVKLTAGLTEEDAKNSPFVQEHNRK
ncbi:hypothetical protein ZIOFF_018657 [Zingiber officinale]|uniref:Uncharacterized protein n=1 Tax=Zingiber officinale TaxID=94328 RepID=A0A8J5LM99_ZINOF|nr:hypothetical protein ZIOFF_018657 [Zingiber officinale]